MNEYLCSEQNLPPHSHLNGIRPYFLSQRSLLFVLKIRFTDSIYYNHMKVFQLYIIMETIPEEDITTIIESRYVEFEERLDKIIEIKIDELKRSIKKDYIVDSIEDAM